MGQTMRVVAIAKALQRRGHDITFIAAGKLIPIIKDFGITVISSSHMPDTGNLYSQQNVTVSPSEMMLKMQEFLDKVRTIELETIKTVQPDIVISGTLTGSQAAQQSGLPSVLVFLQPHGEKTVTMFSSKMQNIAKEDYEKTKTTMLSFLAAADLIILEGMPEISGSATFDNHALTFLKSKLRFTGPLLTEYPEQLPERAELKQLYIGDSNKVMIYITIGGGSALIGEEFLKQVLDCLKLLPDMTGIIATGIATPPEIINKYQPSSNVIIRGFVPGTEMIKASDITIFHGGSSTLMTCIACGTPAIIVPSMGEQEDNGAVLAQNGAGILLDKPTLTGEKLASAVREILQHSAYRTSAQQLQAIGKKYGGADAAATLIEQVGKGAL